MTAAGSWLCGQTPTSTNAQVLIGRLLRKAQLQPATADACLTEAQAIQELALANSLPFEQPLAPPVVRSIQPPKAAFGPWHYLYKALSNRRPPLQAHDSKFQGKWGQFYFLRADARLTMGVSLRRSLPLPRGQRDALIALGKALLAPQVATLDDLKDLF